MAGLNFVSIARKGMQLGKIPGKPESRDWFRTQARKVISINTNRLMSDPNTVSSIMPGKMYMYYYDPKHKATLPYYDVFPLVFPFAIKNDGFLGINLHYLPPPTRARLMDELYTTVDNRFMNENKKLRIQYELLNGAARFSAFKPCVKRYLSGHIRTKFLEIPYDQWDIALMLPTARFMKAGKEAVWDDSLDIIKGNSW
jgi:hypothetical protein